MAYNFSQISFPVCIANEKLLQTFISVCWGWRLFLSKVVDPQISDMNILLTLSNYKRQLAISVSNTMDTECASKAYTALTKTTQRSTYLLHHPAHLVLKLEVFVIRSFSESRTPQPKV